MQWHYMQGVNRSCAGSALTDYSSSVSRGKERQGPPAIHHRPCLYPAVVRLSRVIKVHVSSSLLLNCIQRLQKPTLGFKAGAQIHAVQVHLRPTSYTAKKKIHRFDFFTVRFFCFVQFFSTRLKSHTVRKYPSVFFAHMTGFFLITEGNYIVPTTLCGKSSVSSPARSGESQINPV